MSKKIIGFATLFASFTLVTAVYGLVIKPQMRRKKESDYEKDANFLIQSMEAKEQIRE
jgi:hypothetical protein